MLLKFEKLREERPKVRRVFDEISDFCDKMLVVNYIILFVCSVVIIGVPTALAFLSCPEDIRVWIASIVGGILSLVVIPLLINHIKRKQKMVDELYENNRPLYERLSDILVKLLADEYIAHNKNVRAEMNTAAKQNLIISPLKKFICNGVQREHNKKLNNGLPILHKVPPKRDYGRYFCIMAEKGGTSHGGLTEKLSPFFHAKKQEVNAYGR